MTTACRGIMATCCLLASAMPAAAQSVSDVLTFLVTNQSVQTGSVERDRAAADVHRVPVAGAVLPKLKLTSGASCEPFAPWKYAFGLNPLMLATRFAGNFRMAVLNFDEDEVEVLLTDPHTMLGLSDAGAHASQLCDSGFSTHLLSRWVRERRALTLEDAVRKLTSEPAEIFGITDRGLLAAGRAADVVVFDPATVACSDLRRVHDQPAGADRLVADAIGIDAVVVNGVTIRRDGADVVDPTGPLPGRLLRNGSA